MNNNIHVYKLESEQYLLSSLEKDHKMARRVARRKVQSAFWNTCIVAITAVAGFYAVSTMPDWFPIAEKGFHEMTNYRFF